MHGKKLKSLIATLAASSYLVTASGVAQACTTLLTTDTNGNAYHGRGLEYPYPLPFSMTWMPAGTHVESATPSGKQGVTFDTKYAIIAISAPAVPNTKQPYIAQGANDQGLSFSSNQLNGSSSPPVGNEPSKILSANDLGAWILGNFKTVAEVKAAMQSDSTEFWLPKVPLDNNAPLPQHFAVFDKKGNGIVIEFFDGKKNVYDNPVNALTNNPPFPWHLENLNNYTFNNVDKNTGQLGKLKLASADAGIALTALPSAQTTQGRFVKAAFYANYVRKGKTPDEAINQLAHILNNFDRPLDLTMDPPGGLGDGTRSNKVSSESTLWLIMHDLSRNLTYFRHYDAINWSVVDMNQFKTLKTVKSVPADQIVKGGDNAFTLFQK
ncbi:MAG: hypothetical protein RIQ55_867 [Pseudomonadota bacterium]|jgi:penicillin V acylase-like amidase (Ntn superfamily)